MSQEKASAEQYVQWKQQQGSAGISVNTECGPVVPMTYPWIAATPDGFVHDPQALQPLGLIGFKNPYSCQDQYFLQAIQSKKLTYLSDSSGTLTLKESDTYYYQSKLPCFVPTGNGVMLLYG